MGQFSNPVATHSRTNEVEVPPPPRARAYPRQDRGAKTRPQGQLKCANPRSSQGGGGGWSDLELTDTFKLDISVQSQLTKLKSSGRFYLFLLIF